MNLSRGIFQNIFLKSFKNIETRTLSLSPVLKIKEIKEVHNDKELTIYGEEFSSPRESYLLENKYPTKCPICASGLDIKHTDVLILSQFVRSDGCMLPKRITGLCGKQQKKIGTLVTLAQKAGLMPNLTPASSKKDPKKRYQWKKFNKYFDESTINLKR